MKFFQKSFQILLLLGFFFFVGGMIFFSQLSQTNAQVDETDQQENMEQLELLTDLFDTQFSEEDARDLTSAMVDVQGISLHKLAAIEDFSNRIPLFSGESGGTRFGVDEPLLRAVVAEVLLRLAELGNLPDYQTNLSGVAELNDVEPGVWFEQSMKIAVQNGVFIPKAGKVRPADTVNWAELVTILRRFLGLKSLDTEEKLLINVEPGEWFTAEFFALYKLGVLPNISYNPVDQPMKADFVELLYYAIGKASAFSPMDQSSDVFSCSDLSSYKPGGAYSKLESCTIMLAKNKQNQEICDSLDNLETKQRCYKGVGVALGDLSICEDIGSDCYAEIAVKNGDIVLCNNYSGSKKESCIRDVAEVNKDHSLCSQLDSDYDWECYALVGKATLRVDLCDKSAAHYREDCLNHIAQEKRDHEICYKQSDEKSKDNCLSDLAYHLNDAGICDQITGIADECYGRLAYKLGDVSLCEHYSYDDDRYRCREEIQPSNCDQMSLLCDLNINENYCSTIQDSIMRANCFWAYAVDFKKDRRECEKIELSDKQQGCYQDFDKISEKKNSCTNVKDLELRLTCFKYLK